MDQGFVEIQDQQLAERRFHPGFLAHPGRDRKSGLIGMGSFRLESALSRLPKVVFCLPSGCFDGSSARAWDRSDDPYIDFVCSPEFLGSRVIILRVSAAC